MQDRILDDLQLSEFSDELDVSQHLPLGQLLRVLLVAGDGRHRKLLVLLKQQRSAKTTKTSSRRVARSKFATSSIKCLKMTLCFNRSIKSSLNSLHLIRQTVNKMPKTDKNVESKFKLDLNSFLQVVQF